MRVRITFLGAHSFLPGEMSPPGASSRFNRLTGMLGKTTKYERLAGVKLLLGSAKRVPKMTTHCEIRKGVASRWRGGGVCRQHRVPALPGLLKETTQLKLHSNTQRASHAGQSVSKSTQRRDSFIAADCVSSVNLVPSGIFFLNFKTNKRLLFRK